MLKRFHKLDINRVRKERRDGYLLSLVSGFVVVHIADNTLFHYTLPNIRQGEKVLMENKILVNTK